MKILLFLLTLFMGNTLMGTPEFLYKVVSVQEWEESQTAGHVVPGALDTTFIHLSTEDQVNRIAKKYWASVPEYFVLKLDSKGLLGRLVLEANPGGENKYYHLYEGSIPLNAVVDAKVVVQSLNK